MGCKVATIDEMRRAERVAIDAGTGEEQLMHNAGRGAAGVVADLLEQHEPNARVLVICGPGNNGGDGLVVAETLAGLGFAVDVYTVRRAKDAYNHPGVVRRDDDPDGSRLRQLLAQATIVVDGLLGTGRSRPIEGDVAEVLDCLREHHDYTVVALDVPSGVDADTGQADPHTVPATVTVTFGMMKRGLLVGDGADRAGHIITVDIGLPPEATAAVRLWHIDTDDVRSRIPPRPRNANKYSVGAVLLVTGSRRFTGAPQLAALGAARAGAGLVTVATGSSTHPILATRLVEPTFLVLDDDEDGVLAPEAAIREIRAAAGKYRALIIGPGLAQADATIQLVETLLSEPGLPTGLPIVVDAEGLNALATIPTWYRRTRYPLVLTPHTGEMGRLCGLSSSDVEARRFGLAMGKAAEWNAVVVLKGQTTVIAAPDGEAAANTNGSVNLATGGTGDVLSGVIGALAAQGAAPFDAAVAGVHIHARAGNRLYDSLGDRGALAGDLPGVIPDVIKTLLG